METHPGGVDRPHQVVGRLDPHEVLIEGEQVGEGVHTGGRERGRALGLAGREENANRLVGGRQLGGASDEFDEIARAVSGDHDFRGPDVEGGELGHRVDTDGRQTLGGVAGDPGDERHVLVGLEFGVADVLPLARSTRRVPQRFGAGLPSEHGVDRRPAVVPLEVENCEGRAIGSRTRPRILVTPQCLVEPPPHHAEVLVDDRPDANRIGTARREPENFEHSPVMRELK